MVTAFQDLCLGALLSGVLLLLPLERVAGHSTKKTGRNRKEQQVLWVTFPKSEVSFFVVKEMYPRDTLWTAYQSQQTSERTSVTHSCCTNRSTVFT